MGPGQVLPGVEQQGQMVWLGCYTISNLIVVGHGGSAVAEHYFVSAHKQLRTNVNAFWGPEQAPFTYTMSKWGRESSVEMLSDSDDSYQTPPIVGSSQWDQLQKVQWSRGDGETSLSMKRQHSLSSIRSQPHVLPSGGLMQIHRRCGHRQAKGKLVKASWTNSSKRSVETGSSGSLKRVRSPTLLEYASDHQVLSSSRVPQEDQPSREGIPPTIPSGCLLITLGR